MYLSNALRSKHRIEVVCFLMPLLWKCWGFSLIITAANVTERLLSVGPRAQHFICLSHFISKPVR